MAKHKKKSLAKHQRKKRNKELKAIGKQMAEGFQKGVEEHGGRTGTEEDDRNAD